MMGVDAISGSGTPDTTDTGEQAFDAAIDNALMDQMIEQGIKGVGPMIMMPKLSEILQEAMSDE